MLQLRVHCSNIIAAIIKLGESLTRCATVTCISHTIASVYSRLHACIHSIYIHQAVDTSGPISSCYSPPSSEKTKNIMLFSLCSTLHASYAKQAMHVPVPLPPEKVNRLHHAMLWSSGICKCITFIEAKCL